MAPLGDVRPILYVIGILLTTLGVAMFVPALADGVAGHEDWRVFLTASLFTLFVGVSLLLANRTRQTRLSVRQAFTLTTASWVVIVCFAALPFVFSDLKLGYADAFFEAMSGLTTTGSTVIVGLDRAPPGILLWRALLQWLGGIGIVVMAVAILPMLRVGGMQLFRAEAAEQAEKVLPRTAQLAVGLGAVYAALTALNALLYWAAGMSAFAALCHAMTTVSTGGFSTSDASIAHFDSAAIEGIATVFMVLGSLSFVLYLEAVRGRVLVLWRDTQVRWFLAIAVAAMLGLAGWQWLANGVALDHAVRQAAFNAISVMTGTGYASTDFGGWGTFAVPAFFFLMFVGGCAGSTTGGVKVFRFEVLYSAARAQILQLIQPHGVFAIQFNRRPVPEPVPRAVLGFFFLFALSFAAFTMALGLFGLDYVTAITGAATALANVGPGLGHIIGPAGSFATLPDGAKWLLAFAMLLGRLELFTVLVLFVPSFWRA